MSDSTLHRESRLRVFIRAAVNEPLLKHHERATEWLSSFWMLAWAAALNARGDTFALPPYIEFRKQGIQEEQLAVVMAVVGSLRIGALVINGAWPRSPMIRIFGAGAGVTLWMLVAVLLYMGTFHDLQTASPAAPVYFILALFEVVSAYRATLDVRYHIS